MSAHTNTQIPEVKPVTVQSAPGSPEYEAAIRRWIEIDESLIYRLFRLFGEPLVDYVYRQRANGLENLPATGAFLMVANHSSYLDPFLFARPQQRLLRFMTKASFLEKPIAGAAAKGGGGFPVRRGQGDTFAMDLAKRLLDDGQPVCIFPEGTRVRKTSALGPAKSGAAILAIRTGVPVVPAVTWGAKPQSARGERWFPPRLPKVTTLYGPPLRFVGVEPTQPEIKRVSDEIWAEVQRLYLLAEEMHGKRSRKFIVPGRP